ncbi:MAG: ferredoxin [Syntrophaceae bacterium]|nr:ferredoxin [Syntrophaceae bacterium]
MRVIIKKELCIGCEICVNTCPEVFLEWGLHMRPVFEVREPDRHGALVRQAAEACPARAIAVTESGFCAESPGG